MTVTAVWLRIPLVVLIAVAACDAGASPSSSSASRVPVLATATLAPASTPDATALSPRLAHGALDLEAFGWQMVAPELDPQSAAVTDHWLSVGTLADVTPTWSTKLVESPWRFALHTEQQPVVDGPVAGTVVHVADDGTASEVRAVRIDGRELRPAGATPSVVYAARLGPDAQSVYLVLLDRDTGRDLGVFALALDGDGSIKAIMPPASVDRADHIVRVAAVTRFVRTIRVSADGSMLARLACGEPFGRCVLDVVGLPDGPMLTYEPPSAELAGIGDGYALGMNSCRADAGPCGVSAMSLNDGTAAELPGYPAAVDEDGQLVLLQFPSSSVETGTFSVFDLSRGEARFVSATDGSVRPIYAEGLDFEGVRAEVPRGWAPVWLSWSSTDQGYVRIAAAVRLRDGGWVPLELPGLAVINGGHD